MPHPHDLSIGPLDPGADPTESSLSLESQDLKIAKKAQDLLRLKNYRRKVLIEPREIPKELIDQKRDLIPHAILNRMISEIGRARLHYYDYNRLNPIPTINLTKPEFQKFWLFTLGYNISQIAAAFKTSQKAVGKTLTSVWEKKSKNTWIQKYFFENCKHLDWGNR